MIRTPRLTQLLSASVLWLAACGAVGDDGTASTGDRAVALETLQQEAGAPVTLELNELGTTRVVSMTPRFSAPGHATDPALAATHFLTSHRDLFQLDAAEAADFVVTSVDVEPRLNMRHVTLQRVIDGIPVYRGEISVHMDGGNGVFRVLGNDFYGATAPINRMTLSPREAALAAGRGLGVALSLTLESSEGQSTTFSSPGTLDPVKVEPRVVQVAPGDSRFAYQVLVSWLDPQKQQQYQLTLVDAQDGSLLVNYSLVNTFTGRVFHAGAQPTVNMTADNIRTVVSFNGDPTASPSGWVGTARNTVGNNAVACTDTNANNSCTGEVQPVANASDSFDFPFNPTQNASNFREAAVTNAFYLVNDFHDRTYALGFNEASRNFQTNNFGRGGAGNDPVNVDAQDGGGTNNANFATPPDGSRPRMQMFLWTITGGPTEDGDFDPTVVYHENAHGLSNRLVGGGGGGCLGGLQSGGMGEGWSDFVAAMFLNNPVIGAYVTGDTVNGIRSAPMSNSPWTYNDIRNGTLGEVHDVGELWAAVLWDVRTRVGAAAIQQLVVSGMRLTPCSPTMLQARDAILSADQNINGGANRCAIWEEFAGRLMGTGASSATHNSTSTIVTSSAVPADCGGGGGGGTTVFSDDFEIDRGWTTNPSGTDTATTGLWERANPETTTSGGVTTQNGTTTSGSFALVTEGTAGTSAGVNDVDGGTTSIRSPLITIPSTGTTTLRHQVYFATLTNATSADFLRAQVVTSSGATTTVFEVLGSGTNRSATYAPVSINLTQFAGQQIRILISVADAGTGSLVEASVDDVVITNQ